MAWFGADPGGKKAFGVAYLRGDGTFKTGIVSCADEAVGWLKESVLGAGIDAPLWWSSAGSSDRLADQFIRRRHQIHPGTVQTANSLKGAVLVQGYMTIVRLRECFPGLPITEAHPKALLKALSIQNWGALLGRFSIESKAEPTEHERDALISAIAAREGLSGRWPKNLALIRDDREQDPQAFLGGPIEYWWPSN